MLEAINNFILIFADPLFNWLLKLPVDVIIVIIALITSGLITFSRKWSTDQNWLKRADDDTIRLEELAKEHKKAGQKEDAKRCKLTIGLIKMRSMKYEGKPLLIALVPILLLATWAFCRIGFHPPKEDEYFKVKMYTPKSGLGQVAHLVPQDGIECEGGWVQKVENDTYPDPVGIWGLCTRWASDKLQMNPPLAGVITWKIKGKAKAEPYKLKFVYKDVVYEEECLIGDKTYSTQFVLYDMEGDVQGIELALEPVRPLNFIGGFGPFFPGWLTAYLLLTMPFVPLFKKVFKIY